MNYASKPIKTKEMYKNSDDEKNSEETDDSWNPECPLPCTYMLESIVYICLCCCWIHALSDLGCILNDASANLLVSCHICTHVTHDVTAEYSDDEGTDRVRCIPDRHLGCKLMRWHPVSDEAVAWRESATLEHIVQHHENSEDDHKSIDERRSVCLTYDKGTDDCTGTENKVYYRTYCKTGSHMPSTVETVSKHTVNEF